MANNEVRMVVVGAAGRMGRALIGAIEETNGATLAAAVEHGGSPALGEDAGHLIGSAPMGVSVTADFERAMADTDAILDFTAPAATVAFAKAAAERGIAHVVGTTGLSTNDMAQLDTAAKTAKIVQSGNMSLGVILLSVLVERAAKALEAADWDIEVLEMHHKHKVDAPSGTALLLGDAAASGRGIDLADKSVRTRDGHTGARDEGTIGFATMRGGSVVGDHSVMLAGPGERITLSHHAEDRMIFARGAVKAALWAAQQQPGRYNMRDVLGLS
ncbi:MAG: 4-hydroxy-tetrahydrodipicolinate reductase [Pseudomonadota bacterium]